MVITAPDGSVLRVNDAFCELTQRSREELHQESWTELTHPDDVESNLELTGRILAGEKRTAMVEKRYVRPDQSVVHAVMSITLVRDDEGRPAPSRHPGSRRDRPAAAWRPTSRSSRCAIR